MSEIEVELIELLLQTTLFEQVVDDPPLGEVGLGNFNRSFSGIIIVFSSKVVFDLNIFFFGHL